jgi:hypothetical protein
MSFFRRCAAVLGASIVTLAPAASFASGGGSFGGTKAPAAETSESGFDTLRKPAIPSFLSHDDHKGWVEFWYPPSARDRVAPLTSQATDELRAELAEDLGQTPLEGIEVRVARVLEEMGNLAPASSPPLPQATSVAYPKLKLIVLSLGSAASTEPVELRDGFRRELARIALAEAIGTQTVPAWFAEGFVQHFSSAGEWSRGWVLYKTSFRRGMLPTSELDAMLEKGGSEAELATAEAADFIGFLLRPEKRTLFAVAIERIRQGEALEGAIASAYRGTDISVFERRWLEDRKRWTTLVTLSLTIGLPATLAAAWVGLRALRRRRRRVAAGQLDERRADRAGAPPDKGRVHIVLSRRDDRLEPPVIAEAEIPKVEHEGEWHTLH